MVTEAPIGEKRRGIRRWTWLLPALFIIPVLAFLLSNLWLATPWSCRWMASKIERRTGLEARVGGATWSPWNGVSVHAVELLQPAALRAAIPKPLARIGTIQLAPVWQAWLRGRLEVRTISLDTPSLTIPLELLSHLSASPAKPAPPAIAATNPPPVAQVNPPAAAPPAATTAGPQQLPPPPAIPAQPTGWLHLKDASFSIVSVGKKHPLLEIADATGSLPISGDHAQAAVRIGAISFAGDATFSNLSTTLDWSYPVLSMKPLGLEFQGCKFLVAGKIGTLSGLPIQIEAQVPKQPLASIKLPMDGHAEAQSIAANLGFRGLLLAPATWQADLLAEALAPSISLAGHDVKFDKGSAVTVLRGGLLSCVDARLISDELSLLGNATVIVDGRAAGVIRLVAPPDSVNAIVKRAFSNIESPSLTSLATPQRSAFDLEAFGNIGQLSLRLGKDGPIVNLTSAKPSP